MVHAIINPSTEFEANLELHNKTFKEKKQKVFKGAVHDREAEAGSQFQA